MSTTDMKGRSCGDSKCKGTYQETTINDDWDGVLHCNKCFIRVERYKEVESPYVIYSTSQRIYFVETPTGSKQYDTFGKLLKQYPDVDFLSVNIVKYY